MKPRAIYALKGLALVLCLLARVPDSARAVSCPTGGATLNLFVFNPSNTATVPSVTVSGYAFGPSCASQTTAQRYNRTVTNLLPGETRPVPVSGLDTGEWTHTIVVGTQTQRQNGMVLVSSASNASMTWTTFPNVITVNLAGESGTNPADCPVNVITNPATCTLRKAVLKANQVSGVNTRTLIQFTVSPGVLLASSPPTCLGALNVSAGYITIDGTDANGNPWIVGDSNAAAAGGQSPFPRLVDLSGCAYFNITGTSVTIQGLDVQNSLNGAQQANNLIFFSTAGATNGTIRAVRINGGNTLSCGTCPGPACGCTGARDLINVVGGATVTNVEGLAGLDKGVKSAYTGNTTVQDSWFHNNYRGGLQATLGSSMQANRNMIEQAGFRAGDGAQVDAGANGLAARDTPSQLLTNGNVSRNNILRGASALNTSTLRAANDYLCGNLNGLASADTPTVSGKGVGAVYNSLHGVALTGFSSADFGGGPLGSPGNNMFGQNADPTCDFQNTTATTVSAMNNQWANGTPRTCGLVTASAQSGPNSPLSLTSPATFPGNATLGGQTIRVSGAGFNADGGNPAPSGCVAGADLTNSCCLKVAPKNTCNGIHTPVGLGNCVEYQASQAAGGDVSTLTVTAVTPTTVVAALPGDASTGGVNCVGGQTGEQVWVSKRKTDGTILPVSGIHCTNSGI